MDKFLAQGLSGFQVGNLGQLVVVPLVGDPALVELTSQPLAPIEVDLDFEGKPTLEPNVHEPEFLVQVVQIVVQALAKLARHVQFVGCLVAADAKSTAGFHHREDTNQTFGDSIAGGNSAGLVFLGLPLPGGGRFFQIDQRPVRGGSQFFEMRFQGVGGGLNIRPKVSEQNVLLGQKMGEGSLGEELEQAAFEDQPIEGGQRVCHSVLMYTQKSFHGLSRWIMVGRGLRASPCRHPRVLL